jgi:pilus assembly protein Flp/PilA
MKDLAMNKLTQKIRNFWSDEEGLTIVEYVIGGGVIVVTFLAAFQTFGGKVGDALSNVGTALTGATGGGTGGS